jgi:hypothetical protein
MLEAAEILSSEIQSISIALQRAYALLRLGDAVAERLGLKRWHSEPSARNSTMTVAPITGIDARAAAVTFSVDDLAELGIVPDDLDPFVLTTSDRAALPVQIVTQGTALEIRPLVPFDGEYVLALPAGVGSALRSYILQEVVSAKALSVYEKTLGMIQANLVRQIFYRMENEYPSLLLQKHFEKLPQMQSWCFIRDVNQHVHVVLLHEDLKDCVELGWGVIRRFRSEQRKALDDFLERSATYCETQRNFRRGTTFVIFAGVGRALSASLPRLGSAWDVVSLGLADLDMLAAHKDDALDLFFKFRNQSTWIEKKGGKLLGFSSFSLFCQWIQDDFKIWPRDLPLKEGAVLMTPPSSTLNFRQQVRRARDKHSIRTWSGKWMTCERYGRNAFFKSKATSPIYVCIDVFENSTLAAAIETEKGIRWLICITGDRNNSQWKQSYQIWSDFLNSFADIALFIDRSCFAISLSALEIFLDCSRVSDVQDTREDIFSIAGDQTSIIYVDEGRAKIRLSTNFFASFQQAGNDGERALITAFVKAFECAARVSNPWPADLIAKAVASALPSDDARIVHIFRSQLKSDYLIWNTKREPRWLEPVDAAFVRLNLAITSPSETTVTIGNEACTRTLNEYVSRIWDEIKFTLNMLDLRSVLIIAFSSTEAIFTDRLHWRRTARAILSLNDLTEGLDTSFTREQKRSRTSLATRILAEMALCECVVSGGRTVSYSEFNLLIAKVSLLIEVASDSDAIRGNLAPSRMTIFPNGEYEIDRSYQATIMRPFIENQHNDDYREAAEDYPTYYKEAGANRKSIASDVYTDDFISAFKAEYHLSPDEVIDCFAELSDFATEVGNVVVDTTVGEIKLRLRHNRGLDNAKCEAFVKYFFLVRRQRWEKPPKGFAARDIWPWLFKRRLSIVVRPVVCSGTLDEDIAYFGISQIQQSLFYLLGRASKAWMPQEFFTSQQMRAFAGKTAHALGGVFEDEVVSGLKANGWEARARVQMTELGASQELGDVDVLACQPDGRVLILECKRLQPARTVGEVAEALQKFAGEEMDKLARHIKRLNWLRDSPSLIIRALGLEKNFEISSIQGRLITNTDVPMMYVKDLPIPVSEIIPFRSLMTI